MDPKNGREPGTGAANCGLSVAWHLRTMKKDPSSNLASRASSTDYFARGLHRPPA